MKKESSTSFLCTIVNLVRVLLLYLIQNKGERIHMKRSLMGALGDLIVTAVVLSGQFLRWLVLFIRYQMRCPHHGGKSLGNKKG